MLDRAVRYKLHAACAGMRRGMTEGHQVPSYPCGSSRESAGPCFVGWCKHELERCLLTRKGRVDGARDASRALIGTKAQHKRLRR